MTTLALVILSLLLLAFGSSFIASNASVNDGFLRLTINDNRIIFDASILGGGSSSSFLVSGSIRSDKFLSADLRFHIISSILQFFLSISGIEFKYIDIGIRRYSEFDMYKLNGSLEIVVNEHVLKLLMNFDVLVSGNTSIEKIRVKGAVIPVSSDQKLDILALSLVDNVLRDFFDRVENLSSGLVKAMDINVERIPTTKGIGARVGVLLDVNNPRAAWRSIIGSIFEPGFFDYLELVFDNRVKDYVLDLKVIVDGDESIRGSVSIVFNESFSELLGLNHTSLVSEATLTYYGAPNVTVFNITNMVLEPRDTLKESLREVGLFFYRLIGERDIMIILQSKDTSLDVKNVPVEPLSINETSIVWDKSTALLYLDKTVVLKNNVDASYLFVFLVVVLAALVLFYVARRVRWK